MTADRPTEDLLRELAPQVLGAVFRRYGHFDTAEDAVQEALLAASNQWQADDVPENPLGWLITVAARRQMDQLRSDSARRTREMNDVALTAPLVADEQSPTSGVEDTLALLVLCCHPALSSASQIALTLRAVVGLTTAQIAGAFLVPETTMAQRISRAKQSIKRAGARFEMPARVDADRMRTVLHVLYLIFNEGYTSTSGKDLQSPELTAEAIRLTRTVRLLLPDDGEVAGLLALMLLTDARSEARTRADGTLVPLDEQDRGSWDHDQTSEGIDLITASLARNPLGPYQLQAAIAAIHGEALNSSDTDWPQIVALYDLLAQFDDGPMVLLNRAVALAMADSPRVGLLALESMADDPRITEHHRWFAVRAHLLDLAGDSTAARTAYEEATRRTTSLPEQRYLEKKRREI